MQYIELKLRAEYLEHKTKSDLIDDVMHLLAMCEEKQAQIEVLQELLGKEGDRSAGRNAR